MCMHVDEQVVSHTTENYHLVLLPMSSLFFRGLHISRMRRTSYTMDGFSLLYLLLILLMRSGDVETNPGPNTAESTVSDMEFLKLAHDIPPSYYDAVGISLGIPLAQLHAILIQMSNNYSNAFLRVFMKWKVKQQPSHSNSRQLLADKLREIDLGGLSDRLLNEPLFPISTGGPSRLLESQTKPLLAESQTKPLSPELVEWCAIDFKLKYRSTLCKIRADPLNPASTVQFKDMYTNLVLREEHGTEKRMLDYNDIPDLKVNGEFPKRIMVQGEAGAGKTTFCAKIAWDWIEGRHFSHFVWVLIVPLREFKQHTIGEIAKSYLAKNNPATVSQITGYIRSNPDKVFIAFDGLDEVSGKIMKTESWESQPTYQMQPQLSQPSVTSSEVCGSSSDDIGLIDILCSNQLASCPVLVTTRPWRAADIRSDGDLRKLYTFIHVQGFNRENLSVYIHKYFPKNDDKANQLIQFTSENDVISEHMAHYPLYVAMLCLMWNKCDNQKLKEMKSLKTFSQIFKEMIAFLKEHYAQKEVKKVGGPSLHAYLKKIDELLGPIAKQALNGLLEKPLVFGEDDFQICPVSKDTACRVGILSQEDRITTSMDIHKGNSYVQLPVFFPHKLFQEYMAGVHLASLYESDRHEFNRLIEKVVLPSKEKFRYLLYFTVSQNKTIANHVIKCMVQGNTTNQAKMDFLVDVSFESQDLDTAALVRGRVSSHTIAGYGFIGLCKDVKKEMTMYRELSPPQQMDIEWKCADTSINIKLFDGPQGNEKEIDEKRLGKRNINLLKRFSFEVKPLELGASQKRLIFTLDQKESPSDPSLIEFNFPFDDMGTTRTTAEAKAAGVPTFLQTDLESNVHKPRRTFPPSDYPQQNVGNTSDTQFSQTHREGSSSQSRPSKRQAPCTRSRVPEDDPEIPEEQSKTDLESDRILNKLSEEVPSWGYFKLCTGLDITYVRAKNILVEFKNNYPMATRDCLAQWKTSTGGDMAQLEKIIVDAKLVDLVKHIK